MTKCLFKLIATSPSFACDSTGFLLIIVAVILRPTLLRELGYIALLTSFRRFFCLEDGC